MKLPNLELPKYIGSVEIVNGYVINLVKMPSKKHQRNMEESFGFKFDEVME